MNILLSILLPFPLLILLLVLVDISNAQGTINVCGRTYQDAEDNCGIHPSCANLQCPNKYWEDGQVLHKCFAVPATKCNFGPPQVMTASSAMAIDDTETDNDTPLPSTQQSVEIVEQQQPNTNYCGPIDGGYSLAVEKCSPMTACPSGTPDECGSGWTCYSGVVCDLSSNSNIEEIVASDNIPDNSQDDSTATHDTMSNITESINNEPQEPVIINAPAKDTTNVESTPSETVMLNTNVDIVPIVSDELHETSANDTMASNVVPISESPVETVNDEDDADADVLTTSANITLSSEDNSVVAIMNEHFFCGPSYSVNDKAWSVALEMCSEETSCSNDKPCPGDQICFGGIDCLVKTDNTEVITTTAATTTEQTTVVSTTKATVATITTTKSAIDMISDSSSDVAVSDVVAVPPKNSEQTPPPQETDMYCGPDPTLDGNAWMAAVQSCSEQTACSNGRTCPEGMFCFGNIDCNMKDSYEQAAQQGIAAADDVPEEEIAITTTTTVPPKPKPVIPKEEDNDLEDEDNTFFCGPEVDGWLKAAELCLPCPDGDPENCGLGMTCFSGVVCTKPKTNTAEEMLLEVEERVHLGYCGSEFYETKDNCSTRRPCTLDSDCDMFNPSCYAVSCEDELSPSATIAEGSDTIVTVRASFCGSWYEEALASCSSRSPCKEATDCPEHAGCFSDIQCQFSESSLEYKDFLVSLKELDEVKDTSGNDDDDGKHSNLRPRPSSSTLDAARNDSSVVSYHVYTAVMSVLITNFAWIL